jgi:hypothetical protein
MTATELRKMSPEQKEGLFYSIPRTTSVPINCEKDPINVVIEQYANTKIPLDDIQVLRKELSEIIA